jgi:hypothetical protein
MLRFFGRVSIVGRGDAPGERTGLFFLLYVRPHGRGDPSIVGFCRDATQGHNLTKWSSPLGRKRIRLGLAAIAILESLCGGHLDTRSLRFPFPSGS